MITKNITVFVSSYQEAWKEPLKKGFMEPLLVKMYHELNQEVFEGKLPDIRNLSFLAVSNYNGRKTKHFAAGSYWSARDNSWRGILLEAAVVELNEEQFKKTLIHELVHFMLHLRNESYGDNDNNFHYWLGYYRGIRYHSMSEEIKTFDARRNPFAKRPEEG